MIITARVKKFNVPKGYGFLIGPGVQDIFFHVKTLRESGFETVHEGATVTCEVETNDARGPRVSKFTTIDDSTVHPHVTARKEGSSDFIRAQLKWFNHSAGYGFLTRGEDTPDIFVHKETFRRFDVLEPREGAFYMVRYHDGAKGPLATEVREDTP